MSSIWYWQIVTIACFYWDLSIPSPNTGFLSLTKEEKLTSENSIKRCCYLEIMFLAFSNIKKIVLYYAKWGKSIPIGCSHKPIVYALKKLIKMDHVPPRPPHYTHKLPVPPHGHAPGGLAANLLATTLSIWPHQPNVQHQSGALDHSPDGGIPGSGKRQAECW